MDVCEVAVMQPYFERNGIQLFHGDCREVLPTLPAASVDLVLADPPYPYIKRDYGYWTEDDWWALMRPVIAECRRVLKPSGSAIFILQPNSERVGQMRPWLWEFMAWCCREWNMVQDAWWWNFTTAPLGGAPHAGLLRPSLKACVWLGEPTCYRNQDAVLWEESQHNIAQRLAARAGRFQMVSIPSGHLPSGYHGNKLRTSSAAEQRGGVTPFNVLPLPNAPQATGGGAHGHGAATPQQLCEWWIKYLCPEGGTVLDPFSGSGTVLKAAKRLGRHSVSIEIEERYCAIASKRLEQMALPIRELREPQAQAVAPPLEVA